jgi:hypothetical protein
MMTFGDAKTKVQTSILEQLGLRGVIRGVLLSTVVYGLTPEGMAALTAMGMPPQALAFLAFLGAALRSDAASTAVKED